jgi:anti-anti-sigma factor
MTGTDQPEHDPLSVKVTDSGEWWCQLEVSGELDLATGPMLRQAVGEALGRGRRQVAVDAGALTFMDSSGLVALVAARNDVAAAGGTFRLTAVSPQVAALLEMTGLADELLDDRRGSAY